MSPIRHFPAWLLLPLLWKFVAFHRGIPFSSAVENPQGFGAIATATPFPKILLGTQGRNFSATATLMSWFRATPSDSAALRNSSSKEGCNRKAKLLRLMGSNYVFAGKRVRPLPSIIPTSARSMTSTKVMGARSSPWSCSRGVALADRIAGRPLPAE
jgi:hypothetical protein